MSQPVASTSALTTKPDDQWLLLRPQLSRLSSASRISQVYQDQGTIQEEQDEQDDQDTWWTDNELPQIDAASLALHEELKRWRPVRSDYATSPYPEAFNWTDLKLPLELQREWYIVAFRSKRNSASNSDALYKADRDAHEEAVTAGGLLAYWYGAPSEAGCNLATCIWMSRAHALAANRGKKHVVAVTLAREMYESFTLERYVLCKRRGSPHLTIRNWIAGEVLLPH